VNGFLIDENMPSRLRFVPSLPVIHSSSLGRKISDSAIWGHAKAHSYVIVTKDADFADRIMINQPPPWVVRFCIGNVRRSAFHAFAQSVWPQIEKLLPEHRLVNVYLDRIEAVRCEKRTPVPAS
jgi:predicted nuclease of predicted toxin-antitoxin system